MKSERERKKLQTRYRRLRDRLGKLGWLLQGTITERYDDRVPEGADPRGPYYQWTFKRAGKTVTRNLTAAQAEAYQTAIANHRRLERLLADMRNLSLEYLEATTLDEEDGKRRKTARQTLS